MLAATVAACMPANGPPGDVSRWTGEGRSLARIATADVPDEVKRLVAASALRLRGGSAETAARDLGVRGADAITMDAGFSYDGFAVQEVRLLRYRAAPEEPNRRGLAAVLVMRDRIGRRAAAEVVVDARRTGDDLVIENADWRPVFAEPPEVEMYAVPADALAGAGKAVAADYAALYARVVEAALPLGRGAGAPAEPDHYAIVVFFKDQLPPKAEVAVGISEVRRGKGSYTDATRYRRYAGGWAVAVIPGKLPLSSKTPLWVKATMTGGAAFDGDAHLVGLFSTAPGAGPAS